jgi:RNA polymerase sigma-70 factor (ECF subfamily)
MCDVEEKSYQEIALQMHCAIGTVRSRIHRARVMLRKQMEPGTAPRGRSRRTTVRPTVTEVASVTAAPAQRNRTALVAA